MRPARVPHAKPQKTPTYARSRSPGAKCAPVQCGLLCGLDSTFGPTVMKTIQMTIDDRLLKLVDKMSRARKTTRSAFIRVALEGEIQRQRVREEEARHVSGYARKPVTPGEFDVWNNEQDWGA
jgi:Ribbon-helix-helix protein, copG family